MGGAARRALVRGALLRAPSNRATDAGESSPRRGEPGGWASGTPSAANLLFQIWVEFLDHVEAIHVLGELPEEALRQGMVRPSLSTEARGLTSFTY